MHLKILSVRWVYWYSAYLLVQVNQTWPFWFRHNAERINLDWLMVWSINVTYPCQLYLYFDIALFVCFSIKNVLHSLEFIQLHGIQLGFKSTNDFIKIWKISKIFILQFISYVQTLMIGINVGDTNHIYYLVICGFSSWPKVLNVIWTAEVYSLKKNLYH